MERGKKENRKWVYELTKQGKQGTSQNIKLKQYNDSYLIKCQNTFLYTEKCEDYCSHHICY